MEWNFVAVGPVDAHLEVPAGRIDVHPDSEGPVLVSLEPGKVGSRRGQELVDASEVSFDSNRLHVRVPSKTFKVTDVICTVTVPAGSSLTIKSASADVTCSGTIGDVKATVASADLSLGSVDGELSLTTASGDLRCDAVASRLKVKGASSSVTCGRVGGDVDIALVSGDVEIAEVTSSARVHAVSGDIVLGCTHEGEVRLRTTSGDVTIGVAAGVGAFLDAHSVSGEMTCTLPFDESAPGDAKLRISCETISGDVRVQPSGS